MGKLVSIVETARRFGVTEQTVRNWITGGYIKVKKIGNARYIDEDTVNALQDTAKDIMRQKDKLEKLRSEIQHEREMLHYDYSEEATRRRYMNVMIGAALKSQFFGTVLHILQAHCHCMNEREASILRKYLDGNTLEEISYTFGLSRERIRQIVERTIRKSGDIELIDKALSETEKVKAENIELRGLVENLKEQLMKYEQKEKPSEEAVIINDKMCELFSMRLVDCNLSVRALNCLKSGRYEYRYVPQSSKRVQKEIVPSCETVGDLCKLTKTQFLMLRNAGKKTLVELDDFLTSLGLQWGMDVDRYYQEQIDNKIFT